MIDSFIGNKILFISPEFFGYEDVISCKLSKLGADVDFLPLQPNNSLHTDLAFRLQKDNYDTIFVIKGEYLSDNDIQMIGRYDCKDKILYLYDSVKRYPQVTDLFPYFTKIMTFEKEDAQKFGLEFRPLFFNDNFNSQEVDEYKYDIASISSFYEVRFQMFNKIIQENPTIQTYFKLYTSWLGLLKDKWRFFFKHPSFFFFKPIPQKVVAKILSQSKCILDVKHPDQNGLTMRTLETLALNKKLITTNETVKGYDFYNPNNILILTDQNYREISDFLRKPFQRINQSILDHYTLESFLKDIFASTSDTNKITLSQEQ